MTKVSVIVPIYGVEKYIERCARSLFEQTLDDIEFIFVNDCTMDNSIEVLQKVIKDYPARNSQIRIIEHDVNKGLPEARKTGILAAQGEYIAHCDSDDWVDKEMYRDLYEKAIVNDADMAVCDYIEHDGSQQISYHVGCLSENPEKFVSDMMFERTAWAIWNKLFKRCVYKNVVYYPSYNMGEDMLLTIQLALNCKKIVHISNPYYFYFYNSNSIVRSSSDEAKLNKFIQFKSNLEVLLQFLDEKKQAGNYHDEMIWLKYKCKSKIQGDGELFKNLYKETYPYALINMFFCKKIKLRKKIACLYHNIKQVLR